MITRPLDLAAKLRPAPRNFDALFWVNGAALVLFFLLFGSRFVLAPGLGVDFDVPIIQGAVGAAARTTHVISVAKPGLIFTDDGALDMDQLKGWLTVQGSKTSEAALLVRANGAIPISELTDIISAARHAGFRVQIAALDPKIDPVTP
ncbi:MAG: biopolymer transporter ExbD [Cephaloticoccus sp.]|nr:biopolymer transporter ExbD [Cephaloticoccus sp.]MCF7759110.1 biopolymer transporter ExbD [Cephaloticoccus sp.]